MLHVVSERGLLRTPRSRGDFAPGVVILRAVGMLIVGSLPVLSLPGWCRTFVCVHFSMMAVE